jgi:creatinine amidohydrolase
VERWGKLAGPEIEERLAASPPPIVFQVLGAIEAHGPHLPADTDTVIATELAHRAAGRLEPEASTLLAPAYKATAAACAAEMLGTVHVPRKAAARGIRQALEALFDAGVERVCLLTVHFDPEHTASLNDALDALEPEDRERVVSPEFASREHAKRIGGEFATGDSHAGCFETSLMLAADPDSVDPAYRELPDNEVGLVEGIQSGKRSFAELGMPDAYCGFPSKASPERGEELYDMLAGIVAEACRERWS